MVLKRQLKYYWLRLIRLKGDPHELALGMTVGIFIGMTPTLPFHTAMAVAMAFFFRASKITAALGTWVSNPLNWCILYYLNYKLGAFVLRIPEQDRIVASVISAVKTGGESMVVMDKILESGGLTISAFLLGGLVMGVVAAIPSYFVFLRLFRYVRVWRESRRKLRADN